MRTTVQVVLGDILIAQSQWRQAVTHYHRLLPSLENAQDRGDAIEDVRVNLALAYIELHEPAHALAALGPLLGHVDTEPPAWRGNIHFMLARATWDSGGDRKRAHELATAARADLVGAAQSDEVTKIDRWLASHRVRDPT
jgi:predicted Zn-dependent protease